MSFLSSILDLFFPPKCAFCGKVLDNAGDTWCSKCTDSLPFTLLSGRQEGDYFDFCISPLYYRDIVRKSILRFKFKGTVAYAEIYGKILAECIRENSDVEYDLITWVPLSSKRERSRGYDQAMLLALATALQLGDVAVETLKKTRDTNPQSALYSKETRNENISNAYEAVDAELIKGKRVLIIDDIITTGSTLSECAKTLLEAGAKSIVCAALARGEHL